MLASFFSTFATPCGRPCRRSVSRRRRGLHRSRRRSTPRGARWRSRRCRRRARPSPLDRGIAARVEHFQSRHRRDLHAGPGLAHRERQRHVMRGGPRDMPTAGPAADSVRTAARAGARQPTRAWVPPPHARQIDVAAPVERDTLGLEHLLLDSRQNPSDGCSGGAALMTRCQGTASTCDGPSAPSAMPTARAPRAARGSPRLSVRHHATARHAARRGGRRAEEPRRLRRRRRCAGPA
jgi:hypothetical protein